MQSPSTESSGYGQATYTPYTPPTAGNAIRKASMSVINSTFAPREPPPESPGELSVTSSISNVSSQLTPTSKKSRSPSILYSNSFSTPMSKLKESLHTTAVTNAVPHMSKSEVSPPSGAEATSSPAPFVSPGDY